MNGQVQFVTNEKGEQTGVLLDIDHYYQLVSGNSIDTKLLKGLSIDELEALAKTKLSIDQQSRLNELIEIQKVDGLSDADVQEIEQLLAHIDHLTILKARAMYTLQYQEVKKN